MWQKMMMTSLALAGLLTGASAFSSLTGCTGADLANTAEEFLLAVDWGNGWGSVKHIVTDSAPFFGQANSFLPYNTVEDYATWVEELVAVMPGAKDTDWTIAVNEAKSEVLIYATWEGCHTAALEGYPDPPTGKCTSTNFVYKIHFNGACMIDGLHKVWNDGWSLAELGWA